MALERAIGKAIIERFAPTGMSANMIIRLAQSHGGGYQRSQMLEDIRVAGQRFKNQYWVEELKGNEIVTPGLMVETDLKAARNYRVYGTMSYYDEQSDDYFEETKSFYTDDLAAKDDWVSDYQSTYSESYAGEGKQITGFTITAVEHNRGFPY